MEENEENLLDDFKDDFALLIEAGFVAVKQLDEVSATRLFEAAEQLNPDSTAAQIGLGYIALNKLETAEAEATFKDVLKREPDNDLAKSFLGICYLLDESRRKEGEKLMNEAEEHTDDPTIVNLCQVCRQWADKDLKNAKAPFFSRETE